MKAITPLQVGERRFCFVFSMTRRNSNLPLSCLSGESLFVLPWRIFVIRDFHITEKLENEVQNDFIMKEGRARQLQGTANF